MNKPTRIEVLGASVLNPNDTQATNPVSLDYYYGPNGYRFKQVKKSGNTVTATTKYLMGTNYELMTGGESSVRIHIGDHTIINDDSVSFMHKDHLGYTAAIVNANGDLQETHSFDAFGRPRDGGYRNKWTLAFGKSVMDSDKTTKGYTGHEQLDDVQLTHMNGRIYDYNLGRFLSVDPFMQSPSNTQSMNPYSYIMNNPLAGTDPSGYRSICGKNNSRGCGIIPVNGNASGKTITATVTQNGKETKISVKVKSGVEIDKIGDLSTKDIDSITISNSMGSISVADHANGTDVLVNAYGEALPVLPCDSNCHAGSPAVPDFGNLLDSFQSALDVIGMIPGVGEAADLLNAGISIARGNMGAAAASLAAMVPVAGSYVAITKFASKTRYMDVYHGTSASFANEIRKNGINLNFSRANTDFGKGFYTTSKYDQAASWAARKADGDIVHFRVAVSEFNAMQNLNFVKDSFSWGRFVRHNRFGGKMHSYDTVSGPMLGNPRPFLKGGKGKAFGQQTSWNSDAAIELLNRNIQQ